MSLGAPLLYLSSNHQGLYPHSRASSAFPPGFWYCVEVSYSQRTTGLSIK